jgi:hypothetical protein
MLRSKSVLLAALGVAAVASVSHAATVSFDLAGNGGTASSFSFSGTPNPPPLSLTVTGFYAGLFSGITQQDVRQTANGIGVSTSFLGTGFIDLFAGRINASLTGVEGALFTFSGDVSLKRVTFGFVDVNDQARVRIETGAEGSNPLFLGSIGLDREITINQPNLGSQFSVSATDANDGFTLRSISVEYELAGGPIPIPTPMASLAGAALLAGAAGRRRR